MSETPTVTKSPAEPVRRPQNGAAIRSLREKDGLHQSAFAAEVGLTQSALSNIERERKSARIATLNRIARALRVPTAAIMRDAVAEESAA